MIDTVAVKGIELATATKRGLDHGVFVPLMIMYPKADIPVIQISLESNLNPQKHYGLGAALADLRSEGFMILGSGSSYHNMQGFFDGSGPKNDKPFEEDLAKVCAQAGTDENRIKAVSNWKSMRHALDCHPREEHLIPLFTVLGASKGQAGHLTPIGMFSMQLSNYVFE